MSLLRMDKPSDGVRFLDDLDLTLSMDNRQWAAQQMSSIELTLQPVVFRVSYRDINLITTIVNKAIDLSTKSASRVTNDVQISSSSSTSQAKITERKVSPRSPSVVARSRSTRGTLDTPQVVSIKEQVRLPLIVLVLVKSDIGWKLVGKLDGFRLILIGDLHELPILHLSTRPIEIVVKDWSADVGNLIFFQVRGFH